MSLQLGKEVLYPNSKNGGSRVIKTPVTLTPRKSDYWSNQQGRKSQEINGAKGEKFGSFKGAA